MTDNISVNALEPRPGQPGSENPNIIIPPSVRPTGHSKKKNRKQLWTASYLFWWRWRLCRLQILPCRRTETLLQNRKTKVHLPAFQWWSHNKCSEKMFSPAERKIPNSVPCLNLSNSITWWKWARREHRAGTQTCSNFNSPKKLLEHTLYYLLYTQLLPINTIFKGGKKLPKSTQQSLDFWVWLVLL